MKVARYEFAEGVHFQAGAPKDNPDLVGQHLDLLRQKRGGELTPADVVADARNPNSPLHPHFEWDDSLAAEQHRLSQARRLIRAVVAVYKEQDEPVTKTRAFIHVPAPETPHYRETRDALSAPDTRELVLKRALVELHGWKRRYADLIEFADLLEAIERIGNKPTSVSQD
jgi:hypothetical protein